MSIHGSPLRAAQGDPSCSSIRIGVRRVPRIPRERRLVWRRVQLVHVALVPCMLIAPTHDQEDQLVLCADWKHCVM